jgi:hypothetical protein
MMTTLTTDLERLKNKLQNELGKHNTMLSRKSMFDVTTKEVDKKDRLASALKNVNNALHELSFLL